MPRKPPPECLLILQDVGRNMSEVSSNGEECLKSSKDCIMQILLRKLHSESEDEFALITFGSETTNNELAKGNEYRGIDVKSDHFSPVKREILEQVEKLEVNPNGVGNWLDAIAVAIHFINESTKARAFSQLKIVLFSNFHNAVNRDQVDNMTRKIKNMGIDLTVIGPDVPASASYGEGSPKAKNGEVLISNMADEVEGMVCSFKQAHAELENLTRKATKPTPWNSMLHISSKIMIPIRAFKKIAKPKAFKWTAGIIDDESGGVEKEKGFVKFDETTVSDVQVQKEELIDAFQFGSSIVPFSDIDKESMTYESGPKGLYLVGCTAREYVPQNLLMGDGSFIVLARQDDDVGNHMLQSIIQAMVENEIVGIARRVYNDNTSAYLGVLAPYVTDESRYLVYAQLPYAEDEHIYRFPSFNKTQLADDEMKAVDNLVDAMDLDQIDDEDAQYDVHRMYSPHEQYVLKCLGHKFMHPNEEIPQEIKDSMERALQSKPVVIESCKAALQEVKEKFALEKVIKKTKGKFGRGADEPSTSGISGSTLFQNSVDSGGASSSIDYQPMQVAVEEIVKTSPDDMGQFLDTLKSLREKCLNTNPDVYNKWIPRIKDSLKERNLLSLWNTIVDENLGIISKTESTLSNADDREVDEFLKVEKDDFKNDDGDSMYGSMNADNDDWLDDL